MRIRALRNARAAVGAASVGISLAIAVTVASLAMTEPLAAQSGAVQTGDAQTGDAQTGAVPAPCTSPWVAWAAPGGLPGIWARACALEGGKGVASMRGVGAPVDGVQVAPVLAAMHVNSAFPYVFQSEGVWAGRGVTFEASAGAAVTWRGLHVRIEPRLVHARNADFALPPLPDEFPFGHPRAPGNIDLPIRHGDAPWTRLVPGSSELSLRLGPVVAGMSTATEAWGPGQSFPLVLGLSAEGLPRGFLGIDDLSAGPLGRGHLRVFTGKAASSAWSPAGTGNERMVTGVLGVWQSAGGQLEIGGARMVHADWPGGLSPLDVILRPFDGMLADYTENETEQGLAENGVASVFVRWRIPSTGVEAYGELARDDVWRTFDDLMGEPAQPGVAMLGLARAWRPTPGELHALRAEVVWARQEQDDASRSRPAFGTHHAQIDGLTHRGGMLGTPATFLGGGYELSYRRLRADGHEGIIVRRENQGELFRGSSPDLTGRAARSGSRSDVLHGVFVEAGRPWRGLILDVSVGAQVNLRRYLERDVWNVTARVGVRWVPERSIS